MLLVEQALRSIQELSNRASSLLDQSYNEERMSLTDHILLILKSSHVLVLQFVHFETMKGFQHEVASMPDRAFVIQLNYGRLNTTFWFLAVAFVVMTISKELKSSI